MRYLIVCLIGMISLATNAQADFNQVIVEKVKITETYTHIDGPSIPAVVPDIPKASNSSQDLTKAEQDLADALQAFFINFSVNQLYRPKTENYDHFFLTVVGSAFLILTKEGDKIIFTAEPPFRNYEIKAVSIPHDPIYLVNQLFDWALSQVAP